MRKIEERALRWVDSHISIVVVAACFVAGMFARYALRGLISGDFNDYLEPWFYAIKSNGLSEQVGNYSFTYQFVIWILTKFDVNPLYSYKLVSCLFDLTLAFVVAIIVKGESSKTFGGVDLWAIAFCAIWLSPVVFINSSGWAQCDSIYSTFALLAVYMLDKEKYNLSMILLGVGFAFKLQTVFIFPVFVFFYYASKKFSIIKFLLVPIGLFAVSAPLLLWGRDLSEILGIYLWQSDTYFEMSHSFQSIWTLLCGGIYDTNCYPHMKYPSIVFTAFALVLVMLWFLQKGKSCRGKNLYILSFLLVYTCVMFLPSMHERYSYLYEILAIVIAVLVPKTLPLCFGLICLSLNTYGAFLFHFDANFPLLTCVNLIFYFAYFFIFNAEFNEVTPSRRHAHERTSG